MTFPSRGKSPKARQGLRPLESSGAKLPPFSRSLTHRAGLVCATEKDRFATLRWWANRSLLFPLALTRKNILLLIRGAGHLVARLDATFGGIRGIGGGGFVGGRWSGGVTRGVTKWCNQLGKGGAEPVYSYFIHNYPCKKRTSLQAGYRLVPYLVTPQNGFVKPFVGLSVTKVTNFYKKRYLVK